ncbi:GNAT family N-acetyltransferase [Virgibacillus siamensis]|uniref:GNAT family N-acetyltransferase n=1 Tax=Virgibacillus siamensis TaxID=480071 RepID=UPI00098557E9|nr:GNAT family protein [Virgibacillus siamensis]
MKGQLTEIPILETGNFLLRAIAERDAEDLFYFLSQRKTMQYITPHPVESQNDVLDEILQSMERFVQQTEIPWVIVDKRTGVVIGKFSFHKLSMWHKKAEMAAVISQEYQNSGVMTEVLETVLDYGFDTLELNRIAGDIFAANDASRKLLQNYGFREEGTMRQTDFDGEKFQDTIVFSQLKPEYDARKRNRKHG